jgi:hypothetical protein
MTDEPVTTPPPVPTNGGKKAGNYEVGKGKPPKDTQFGGPRANPRGKRAPKDAAALNRLIDEIASETVVNPSTGEQVQRIRAMLRGMMTGRDSRGKVEVLNRRYGKVKDEVDVTSGGESLVTPPLPDEERLARMKQLAAVIAEEIKKNA